MTKITNSGVCQTLLLLLLLSSYLCACSSTVDGSASPKIQKRESSTNEEHESSFSETAEEAESVVSEIVWETCTVRVINYAIGTEFFVLHSDGSYSIYGTTAICSLSAFNKGKCPVDVIQSGELSAEELDLLKEILPIIYKNGEMLPVVEMTKSSSFVESVEVFISVDDSEEVSFYKNYDNWAGYPQLSYDMLLQLAKSLDPQSVFLH